MPPRTSAAAITAALGRPPAPAQQQTGPTTNVRIALAGGNFLHEGWDDRDTVEIVKAIGEAAQAAPLPGSPDGSVLPGGWVWIAGAYMRAAAIVSVESLR